MGGEGLSHRMDATMTFEAKTLYRRHGFEVRDTIQVGSSPPIFPMLRPAR